MGFIENFKIKRAAKKAKAVYQLALNEWEQENRVLNAALDIFTTASKGDEPDDLSLVQKKGEFEHSGEGWKQKFLMQISGEAKLVIDGENHRLIGLPFFNAGNRNSQLRSKFNETFKSLFSL